MYFFLLSLQSSPEPGHQHLSSDSVRGSWVAPCFHAFAPLSSSFRAASPSSKKLRQNVSLLCLELCRFPTVPRITFEFSTSACKSWWNLAAAFLSPLISCTLCFALQAPLPHIHIWRFLEKSKLFPASCSAFLLRIFFSWLFMWLESCPSRLGLMASSSVRTFTTLLKKLPPPCSLPSQCLACFLHGACH